MVGAAAPGSRPARTLADMKRQQRVHENQITSTWGTRYMVLVRFGARGAGGDDGWHGWRQSSARVGRESVKKMYAKVWLLTRQAK
jgi:hypothetical protein